MQARTRILVVDDDEEIRQLLDEYLTKSGFDIVTTADGIELLAYLERNSYPDLILLDVMMPGDDGFTLCQKISHKSLLGLY